VRVVTIGSSCFDQTEHTQLAAWRAACEQANDWDQAASAEQRAYKKANDKKTKKLESELARKEKALAEVASLLVLRGKLDALYEKDGAE